MLGFILIFQLLLSAVCAVGYAITRRNLENGASYIQFMDYGIPMASFIIFLTYFVLLNTMIPISLIVTIEMVKLFQKYFIEKDRLMYSSLRDKHVTVQSASLNE